MVVLKYACSDHLLWEVAGERDGRWVEEDEVTVHRVSHQEGTLGWQHAHTYKITAIQESPFLL